MNRDKVVEWSIFVLSLGGNAFIVQQEQSMQLIACILWSISNTIAISLLWHKGLKILALQNFAFMFFNIYGIYIRT